MKNIAFLFSLLVFSSTLFGQSMFENVSFDNIGPTVQSGRVTDIAVNPDDPTKFYVAYASGGLWYTENNGTTFSPLFDEESVMTIGDIAVDWNNGIIWVGTGEVNSSRSSYAGNGIYKSTDKGKSWTNIGLPESHHIGRIVLDPTDANVAWIAVLGHLYTANKERGIYKTTDGGTTWSHTLFVNENAGAVDLVMDPTNKDHLYAAIWQRERRAWNFVESGEGSGIYKSEDAGNSWSLITDGSNSFPTGTGVGRIGLDIAKSDNGIRIYALLDNYNRRPKDTKKKTEGMQKDDFKTMTSAAFSTLDNDQLKSYLKKNGFPEKYSVKEIKSLVKKKKIVPSDIAYYTENANSLLFDTPVIGAELYMSDDQGKTWQKTHKDYIEHLYNSYGYYFGQVRVAPDNIDKVVIMGVPILISNDAGKIWKNINGDNVHVDHHALWINPKRAGHMINGNDGGINITYDYGESWIKCNSPSVGQFYYINVDNEKPYNVYGGLQDNGVWKGSNNYSKGVRWHNSGHYPYKSIMGGDGMQVQTDNRNANIVYTGYQFGNYFRMDLESGKRKYITPKHELGDRPYRWNWQSPILLSNHNQDIVYLASNKLLRSFDQGNNFEEISEDLTNGGQKGDVPFGTISSIDESKLKFGLIYTGSDDGKVWRTKDGGNTWDDISRGLPQGLWVSRIQASQHTDSLVYLSLNAYRNDDFNTYLFRSHDFGNSWIALDENLVAGPANVIKEDPNNSEVLFVGTDHGTYISTDNGDSFQSFASELPNVPVHDIVIQSRDKDLLIGTHGRSIYKADISFLDKLNDFKNENLYVFEIQKVKHSTQWGKVRNSYTPAYEPKIAISIYSQKENKGTFSIFKKNGKKVHSQEIDLKKGIAKMEYDLAFDEKFKKEFKKNKNEKSQLKEADNGKHYLVPGEYKVQIKTKGQTASNSLIIEKPKSK